MRNNPLQVGVMGCASIAERMVIPAIMQSEDLSLHTVASRNVSKAENYAQKFQCRAADGYESLLHDPEIDLIYMPLPTALHHHWAVKALEAGKHVLLEKSLACNLAEANEIVDAARRVGKLVKENFMFAYHPQMQKIKEILSSGRLGEIRCIRSSFGFPPFPDSNNIRYSRELGGGALLDAGAYTLKVATELLGNSISVGSAALSIDPGKGVDLFGGIFLTAPGGIVIETAFGFDHFYQCSLEIWGSRAKLTADRIFTAGPGISPKIRLEEAGNQEIMEIPAENHFLNLLNATAAVIESGDYEIEYHAVLRQAALLEETRQKAQEFILS